MADEADEAAGKQKSSKLVLILIILVAVLLLGLGGAAGWYFFLRDEPVATETVADQSAEKAEAIYVKIRTLTGKPYFIANFNSDQFGAQRFLQVYVEARTREPDVKEALEKHMPLIVHSLSTLFSKQSLADMQTLEGKERLRSESTKIIQEIMQKEIGKPGVEEVFFTNFVMQ